MSTLDGLGFPEALRWRDGALWFSDMFRSRVMRWVPGSAAEVVLDAAGGGPIVPGGLGWLPDGSLLVVDCERRRVLRLPLDSAGRAADAVAVHADLARVMTHSANDMHVDVDGTAWVGGYGFDPENDEPATSPLVRVGPDGDVSTTASLFVFPNGCQRDAGGALLVAETFADRVSSFSRENELTRSAKVSATSKAPPASRWHPLGKTKRDAVVETSPSGPTRTRGEVAGSSFSGSNPYPPTHAVPSTSTCMSFAECVITRARSACTATASAARPALSRGNRSTRRRSQSTTSNEPSGSQPSPPGTIGPPPAASSTTSAADPGTQRITRERNMSLNHRAPSRQRKASGNPRPSSVLIGSPFRTSW